MSDPAILVNPFLLPILGAGGGGGGGGGDESRWSCGSDIFSDTPPSNSEGKDGDFYYYLKINENGQAEVYVLVKYQGSWTAVNNNSRMALFSELKGVNIQNDSSVSGGNITSALNNLKNLITTEWNPVYSSFQISDSDPEGTFIFPSHTNGNYPRLFVSKKPGEYKADVGLKSGNGGYTGNVLQVFEKISHGSGSTESYQNYSTVPSWSSPSLMNAVEGQGDSICKLFIQMEPSLRAYEVTIYCIGMFGGGNPAMTIHVICKRVR
jgi:hypothetical protein